MATKTELEESAAAVEECLFLVHFAQIHETFRKAELEALAELHGIQMEWKDYSDSVPPHPQNPHFLTTTTITTGLTD